MSKVSEYIYSIRQVIELTGISEFTLRGWEGRHRAFNPHRSKTGRRLYCKSDILKIRLLVDLLNKGHRIGKVAHLDAKNLKALSETTLRTKDRNAKSTTPREVIDILSLASNFEWDKVQARFLALRKIQTAKMFIFRFLLPLIAEMNVLVGKSQLSITQEHIMSALIKEILYQMISAGPKKYKTKLRIVLATPEGDFHEIGVLIASALLADKGIRQLYLGPNVPETELCEASLRFSATHVLVSSTISTGPGAKSDLFQYIHFIDRHLAPSIQLLLGGRNISAHPMKLEREHQILRSFEEFDKIF